MERLSGGSPTSSLCGVDGDLTPKKLGRHKNLSKAESSLAVQMRSKQIGLADYLFSRHMPTFLSPACNCGWARQTLKNILFDCPKYADSRSAMCRDAGTTDFLLATEGVL